MQSLAKKIWSCTWTFMHCSVDKTQQNGCAPSEDSDQPGHPPSLIRDLAVRMKKAWVLSYPLSAQWRPWWDWADAQADLSLRWAHTHFVGFVMSWFIYTINKPSCGKMTCSMPPRAVPLTRLEPATSRPSPTRNHVRQSAPILAESNISRV